jgi:glycerol-3-phosphate acyltransferase PlsY
MKEVLILIFSYLLGSIPFGYIFTKIFAKKNILEIGWRKTSGSNVFKHVGILPGILTGIGDVLKGTLAVYLAKKLNFSLSLQSLCALLAVIGHNWSIFLKFAGGRGIATFIGCLLILAPQILFYSLFPVLLLVLILDSSIATIFFLLLSIYFSFKTELLIFTLPVFFFILLKRLSPIGELSFKNKKLILSRLIFDGEVFHQMNVKKIIQNLTKK